MVGVGRVWYYRKNEISVDEVVNIIRISSGFCYNIVCLNSIFK